MRRSVVGLFAVAGLLAACQSTGGPFVSKTADPFAPGTATRGTEVDGLLVGHRLMQAGEYDLALRAYYRAAGTDGMTAEVVASIGSAELKMGRLGQAETDLRQAVKIDETFVPAWNNLGVVLMNKGQVAEASRVFKTAFALDSGRSDEIRKNLRLALAKMDNPTYDAPEKSKFSLVRRGQGEYLLLSN